MKSGGMIRMPLDRDDIERLDGRYMKKDDCAATQKDFDKRMDEGEKTAAVLTTKLNAMIGILAAIAVPILAIAVKLLFRA